MDILLVYLLSIFISWHFLHNNYKSDVVIILIYLILHDFIMCTTLSVMNLIIFYWKWIACSNILIFYLSIILFMPTIILLVGCHLLNFIPTLFRANSCCALQTILSLSSCQSFFFWALSSWYRTLHSILHALVFYNTPSISKPCHIKYEFSPP